MDVSNSTPVNSPATTACVWYSDKMDIPIINDSHILSFILVDHETVVQHVANDHDDIEVVSALAVAATNFSKMNDGLDTAIVHRKHSMLYYITTLTLAFRLDTSIFDVIHTTVTIGDLVPTVDRAPTADAVPAVYPAMAPVSPESNRDTMVQSVAVTTKDHIRRPRNQFIIYRQWMSARLHEDNPGLTAGAISSIVAKAWKGETPQVKAHFKALAVEEDRKHKLAYPGYRYQARRTRNERRKLFSTIKAVSQYPVPVTNPVPQYPVQAMSSLTTTDLNDTVMNLGSLNN
ncbi:Sporulation minus regulator 2 [Podospora pseudopauciseta]|uniref:Sporulation minus regulator 2 n=1 Tax=Podospora pseudopauciseta TaxID=2093780 RepID=A0ABR0I2S4_9PEZI|nr:Sporulation minus regulator 2 [Podospora pseudopauciseta]